MSENYIIESTYKSLIRDLAAEDYFRFLTEPNVEPTNNGTERQIRPVVIDQRITQGQPSSRRLRVFSVRTLSNGSKSRVCCGFTILCIIAPSICYKRACIIHSYICLSTLKLL